MIGNVIAPLEGHKVPVNPDNYFDPTTHIATEANFIAFLNTGTYTEDVIGYKVTLSNSSAYNGGTWIIADVNHDSGNTGQTGCYDLISQDCINPGSSFGNTQYWRSSNVRTWSNGTFYSGFSSNLKNRLMNPKYNSDGSWYTDDIVIIPSFIEVNGTTGTSETNYVTEGVAYPIFTDDNSRIKNQFNSSAYYWWTRSRCTSDSGRVWFVYTTGILGYGGYYSDSWGVALVLRIS